jgi:four helix bundle protein
MRSAVVGRMATFGSFRDLDVWRVSMDLVDLVIGHCATFPEQHWWLKRQMQSAAVSIPSNVAEGYRRKKRLAAYQNHVSIAMGSQGELETQLKWRSATISSIVRDAQSWWKPTLASAQC